MAVPVLLESTTLARASQIPDQRENDALAVTRRGILTAGPSRRPPPRITRGRVPRTNPLHVASARPQTGRARRASRTCSRRNLELVHNSTRTTAQRPSYAASLHLILMRRRLTWTRN